jgi:exonuclease III
MMSPGKLKIIQDELTRYNIPVCGLAETHYDQSGHFESNDYTVYASSNETQRKNGVAIMIHKRINHLVTAYRGINDRAIVVTLNTSPVRMNLVQVYAPTSEADEEDIQ